jgi:hypothetical protein
LLFANRLTKKKLTTAVIAPTSLDSFCSRPRRNHEDGAWISFTSVNWNIPVSRRQWHYRLLTVREVDRRAVWPKISIDIANPSMLVDVISVNNIVCINRCQET